MELQNQLAETASFIKNRFNATADTGIILGTGLNTLPDHGQILHSLPYTQTPHFPVSTAPTHLGKLMLVLFGDKPIWVLSGRLHYYEGFSMQQITYPIRTLSLLGVQNLFITNASGSINSEISSSDIVLVEDHINLLPDNPLRGLDSRLGERFIEMSDAYDRELLGKLKNIARQRQIQTKNGVYVAVQGPSLETRAEYRYLHSIGADIVGMSSVPEVIVARQLNMKVAMISIVSNQGYPKHEKASLQHILDNVHKAVPDMATLLSDALQQL